MADWTTYPAGGISITNAGVTNIEARTVDGVGNVGPISTSIVKIDRINPAGAAFTLNAFIMMNLYTSRTVNLIKISASDAGGAGDGSGN